MVEPAVSSAPPPVPGPATPTQPDVRAAEQGGSWLWWLLGIGIVAVAAVAFLLGRRQGQARRLSTQEPVTKPIVGSGGDRTQPLPIPSPSPAPETASDPRVEVTFRPVRAGLNVMSAVVEGELTLLNASDAPIEAIRVAATLLGAHKDQDAELAAVLQQRVGRPAVPAFALGAGEARAIRIVAPLARAMIRSLTAGNRPILVPIVAIGGTFMAEGIERRIASAFVIGVERAGSVKLAPIWLDVPPRMYDTVAARPQALPVGFGG